VNQLIRRIKYTLFDSLESVIYAKYKCIYHVSDATASVLLPEFVGVIKHIRNELEYDLEESSLP
jgi:hypothetical protein